jgi:hypothetical protein
MTKSCARDLTDRIKKAADDLAEMLWRAYQGKAWAALGYSSWKEYCDAEFQMTERHSYRLLDFVEIKTIVSGSKSIEATDQLDSVSNTDQLLTPTHESQTRALKSLDAPEQKIEAWKSAVEGANGKQPTAKQVKEAADRVAAAKEDYMSNEEADDMSAVMCFIDDMLDKHKPAEQRELIDELMEFLTNCKIERKIA